MPTEEDSWVIFELSPHGERVASDGLLRDLIRGVSGLSGDDELFVPYLCVNTKNSKHILNVIEGYIFVRSSISEETLRAIENSPYIKGTISFAGRGYSTVPNSSVGSLKDKLGEMVSFQLTEGQPVRIGGGPLCGIGGTLLIKGQKSSQVLIKLRSLEAVRVFHNHILEPVYDAE